MVLMLPVEIKLKRRVHRKLTVKFARLDQAVHHRPPVTSVIISEEQPVFLSQADGAKGPFGGVIVCALQGTIFPSVKIRPG